jgi:hypothetical protein
VLTSLNYKKNKKTRNTLFVYSQTTSIVFTSLL